MRDRSLMLISTITFPSVVKQRFPGPTGPGKKKKTGLSVVVVRAGDT